jgi:hypothetical protein
LEDGIIDMGLMQNEGALLQADPVLAFRSLDVESRQSGLVTAKVAIAHHPDVLPDDAVPAQVVLLASHKNGGGKEQETGGPCLERYSTHPSPLWLT